MADEAKNAYLYAYNSLGDAIDQSAILVSDPTTSVATMTMFEQQLTTGVDKLEDAWVNYNPTATEVNPDEYRKLENDVRVMKRAALKDIVHYQQRKQALKDQGNQPTPTPVIPPAVPLPLPKLPEIKIPKFSGKYEEWIPFWDLFSNIIDNRTDLADVIKFSCLRSHLSDRAFQVIAGLPVTSANYAAAVEALKDFYTDNDKLQRQLMSELNELRPPKYVHSELMNFKLSYEKLLYQLDSLNMDKKAAEPVIQNVIVNKLPPEAKSIMVTEYHTMNLSVTQISKGLKHICNLMDFCGQVDKPKTNSTDDSSKNRKEYESHGAKPKQKVSANQTIAKPSYQSKDPRCHFCEEKHFSSECATYIQVNERKQRLMENRACLRCGNRGHYARDCRRNLRCYNCRGDHWTPLCFKSESKTSMVGRNTTQTNTCSKTIGVNKQPSSSVGQNSRSESHKSTGEGPGSKGGQASGSVNQSGTATVSKSVVTQTVSERPKGGVALPTARVKILSHGKGYHTQSIRGFFDMGSQKSFIHPDVVDRLGLVTKECTTITLSAFGKNAEQVICPVITLKVALGKRVASLNLLVTNKVKTTLTTPGITHVANDLRCQGIHLADRFESDEIMDIEILIGADNFGKLITGTRRVGSINLLTSPGGELIFGPIPKPPGAVGNSLVINQSICVSKIAVGDHETFTQDVRSTPTPDISKLWDLEVIGIKAESMTPNDKETLSKFSDSIVYEDNQYWVNLPWKLNPAVVPTNYRMARGQLNSLMRNLEKEPEKLKHYHEIIQDYVEKDFIEEVTDQTVKGHYLPHHGVLKDSKTTPLRIVFNASAKINNETLSLNDALETGPALTEKLQDTLVNFRTKRYGLTADISKAFLRVGLKEQDRDYVRFLWLDRFDGSIPKIKTYRFKSVLFGSTSSPFLLQATLYKHFQDSNSKYKETFSHAFYVDNFAVTVNDESELYLIQRDAMQCLDKANMPLNEWNSNSAHFNECINDPDRKEMPSILGIVWNTKDDTLHVKSLKNEIPEKLTKRSCLSLISTVYDPLGLVSPITIKGKVFMRKLWQSELEWDENISRKQTIEFHKIMDEYRRVDEIEFPRSIHNDEVSCDLHIFCDASKQAYGCVAYVVKEEKASLYLSRTRVAPVKERTIPQLELTALLIGCRLALYINNTVDIKFASICVWSDNMACLEWLEKNHSSIVYVQNRVREILDIRDALNIQFYHVDGKNTPADLLSRGCGINELKRSNWQHGPEWLTHERQWPDTKKVIVNEIMTQNVPVDREFCLLPLRNYSSFGKLIRITDYVFAFLKVKFPGKFNHLDSRTYWMKYAQRTEYPLVYKCLKSRSTSNEYRESLKFIKDLGLYLDDEGIIRSQGRLNNIYPDNEGPNMNLLILLPPRSYLCHLLVLDRHNLNHHAGVQDTLNAMRHEFWIPKGRQIVKKIVNNCILCKYDVRKAFRYPEPPPLPAERVNFERPFQFTAVDFTGAINIKEEGENLKYYICLFTCMGTRAIHLELINALSAEAFLLCFRRFSARCSIPEKMFSDNGSNFIAMNKFLKSMQEHPDVRGYLGNHRIEWYFNTPRCPWKGGVFERMIKIVKDCLSKSLQRRQLSATEMITVLYEVEAVVNNRPLSYMTGERNDIDTLTPAHLLYGRKIQLYPNVVTHDYEYDLPDNLEVIHEYHNKLVAVINKFKRLWQTSYLQSLREKHYGNVSSNDNVKKPEVNEIVIVRNGNDRSKWTLGKIVECHEGTDRQIREVVVFSEGRNRRMGIDKLIPLELHITESEDGIDNLGNDNQLENEASTSVESSQRQRRSAAKRADDFRKDLIARDEL